MEINKRKIYILAVFFTLVLALVCVRPVAADSGIDAGNTGEVELTGTNTETSTESEDSSVGTTISRDSVEITAEGDPYFKVGSTTMHFYKTDSGVVCDDDPTCQVSDTPIQAAVDYMASNNVSPSDHKLYIDADTYSDDLQIDGTANGVKNLTGLIGMGDEADDVVINGGITVHDMPAGFTISNLTVNNSTKTESASIYLYQNAGIVTLSNVNATATGVDSYGIFIQNIGNVVLDQVNASNNSRNGVEVDSNGSVTVQNSTFNNNGLYGIEITFYDSEVGDVSGLITVNNVTANNNGVGVSIHRFSSNVVVKNGVFLENEVGIYSVSRTIVYENLLANQNEEMGIYGFATNSFMGTNLIAESNGTDGIYIKTCSTYNDSPCSGSLSGTTILRGIYTTGNGQDGISILAKGSTTIYNVYSAHNTRYGINVDSHLSTSAGSFTFSYVEADYNKYGIWADLMGLAKGSNFTAKHNTYDGLNITGEGIASITLTVAPEAASLMNEVSENGNDGFLIFSSGMVNVYNMYAHDNGNLGGVITNCLGYGSAVTVTSLEPGVVYSIFSGNTKGGLSINSFGATNVASVISKENKVFGLSINGYQFDRMTNDKVAPVTIINSVFINNCNQNEQGDCVYSTGSMYGIHVVTSGLITLTNVTADSNDGTGALLENQFEGFTAGIIVKGNSDFSNNYGTGLYINTNGQVSIAWQKANGNHLYGIVVHTENGIGSVTIIGIANATDNVSGNEIDGIYVVSNGSITLTNIDANDNYYYGAHILNDTGSGNIVVTNAYFDGNNIGLEAGTAGVFTWKNGWASDNRSGGGVISCVGAGKSVNITNMTTDRNGGTGLSIVNKGTVTLTNVSSSHNSLNYSAIQMEENWTDLLNQNQTWTFTATESGFVTIQVASEDFNPYVFVYDVSGNLIASDISGTDSEITVIPIVQFLESYSVVVSSRTVSEFPYSIRIFTGVNVPETFTSKTAAATGISIDNSGGVNAAVTLKNSTRLIASNNDIPLMIVASGPVSVINLTMIGSLQSVTVDNSAAVGVKVAAPIILSKVDINGGGFLLVSNGAITIASVSVVESSTYGISLQNDAGNFASIIKLSDANVSKSACDGVLIRSLGIVTLSNVRSNGNNTDGLADSAGIRIISAKAVVFTGVTADENTGFGSLVTTSGSFSVNKSPSGRNSFSGNTGTGLSVSAADKVTMSYIDANNNKMDGGTAYGIMVAQNNPSGQSPIAIKSVSASGNDLDGIYLLTQGTVTVNSLTTKNNGSNGLNIQQNENTTGTQGVITLIKIEAGGNGADGILVEGYGNITVSQFIADGNGVNGIHLDNSAGVGTVTILNPSSAYWTNSAQWNLADGIHIKSGGKVMITGVITSNNSDNGLVVDNSLASVGSPVILSSIIADNNGLDGINITSKGVVTVNGGWALANGNDGIEIVTPANVSISMMNSAMNNWAGMRIDLGSTGSLVLKGSSWYGNIRNDPVTTDKNLIFSGASITIS